MLTIDIISLLPELLTSPFDHSIIKRARQKNLLQVNVIDLREYGVGKHRQLDDYQYGGGAGMVMMIEPLFNCINDLKSKNQYDAIVYLTPDGKTLNQGIANHFSTFNKILFICGHYKGIDHRVRDHLITHEISIGDFVLSGGETAAIIMVDAIGRLLPGVLNNESSALSDSFQDNLLAPPVYSRPAEFNGWKVPEVLLSGHDAKIEEWRTNQSLERTKELRPDLLEDE